MKKKKNSVLSSVSERDKKLLFLLGAILVLAIAYFFVFRSSMEKADEYSDKNEGLRSYIVELDNKIANEEVKKAEIIMYNEERSAVLDRFAGGMSHELAIDLLSDLETETEFEAINVTLSVNDIFFNQQEAENNNLIAPEEISSVSSIAVQGHSEQEYTKLIGYKTSLTVEFACTDEQLRAATDFINAYDDKMSVESITVGYDETTGGLTGTMVICMYAVDGNDKEYEEPSIDNVTLGVPNIFGQKSSVKKNSKR